MEPIEVDAAVATRWADVDELGCVSGEDGTSRWLEITVSLPGVRNASDVLAEVLGDAKGHRLSVRATTSGRDDVEVKYRADVPLPPECDAEPAPRVKFSKKKMVLVVRFPPRKQTDAVAASANADGLADTRVDTLAETLAGTVHGADTIQHDSENPLAEYLSMLGADAAGREKDACDAVFPVKEGQREEVISECTTATNTTTPKTRDTHGECDDNSVATVTKPVVSGSSRNRKKQDGRRRKAEKKAGKNQPQTQTQTRPHLQLPLFKNVKLAKSVAQLDDMADSLACQLGERGWATCEFITPSAVRAVREEIENVAPFYTPGEIWLGKADAGAQISVKSVRGDRVFWMDPDQIMAGRFVALASTLQAIDTLVLDHMARDAKRSAKRATDANNEANVSTNTTASRLSNLADRTHAMLAEYPGCSSRFVKHVDNTAGDGRRLTVLCYLNEDWLGENGGSLKVYDDARDQTGTEVAPAGGRIVMFYADQTPHEVLPSFRSRHSFTVWYYDEHESKEASKLGRDGNDDASVAKTAHAPGILDPDDTSLPGSFSQRNANNEKSTEADDQQASAFVKTMMTENLTPTAAYSAAKNLSAAALTTAARVFGAPNGKALLEHVRTVTENELAELRSEMTRMGMEG